MSFCMCVRQYIEFTHDNKYVALYHQQKFFLFIQVRSTLIQLLVKFYIDLNEIESDRKQNFYSNQKKIAIKKFLKQSI